MKYSPEAFTLIKIYVIWIQTSIFIRDGVNKLHQHVYRQGGNATTVKTPYISNACNSFGLTVFTFSYSHWQQTQFFKLM